MLTRYAQKNLAWIDLVAPTQEEVRALMQELGFNPIIGQELLSLSPRPKVERFDDALYAVFHLPTMRTNANSNPTKEIDILVGKNYLITTRYEDVASLNAFAKAFEVDSVLASPSQHLHGGHLFASIMRNLYRALAEEADIIQGKLEHIEKRLFDNKEKLMVLEISRIGSVIYDFRQALSPHDEMLRTLEAPLERMFGREYSYYIRSTMAEHERARELIDVLRESMLELRETNNSLLSAKQNEVMKNFSVLAFVFVPVSLIMGLYQMGLPGTPFVEVLNFWVVLSGISILSIAFFIYFKIKGWL